MFSFAWPWMGLLLLLPLLVRLLLPALQKSSVLPNIRFPHLEILEGAFAEYSLRGKGMSWLFITLLSLLWVCLVLALMRPQYVDQMTEVRNEGYDIMLAVDLSGSMRGLDFSTQTQMITRLDIAKVVVGDFVKDRKSDRVGLVLFGDYAYQYAPLTLDTESVSQMLNETTFSMAGDGTAIGDAIGLAVKALRDRPEKSRIIILLTDGEDTASSIPPEQAAQLAKQYGIKIYTIGIGKKGIVPALAPNGQVGRQRSSIDERLLQTMADMTGGKFYRATDTNALLEVYNEIDQLEKTEVETRQYMVRTTLYRYPLGIAVAALLLIALFPLAEGRKRYG